MRLSGRRAGKSREGPTSHGFPFHLGVKGLGFKGLGFKVTLLGRSWGLRKYRGGLILRIIGVIMCIIGGS